MYSFFLSREIQQDKLLPCYFIHGEETYPAKQFIDELRLSINDDAGGFNLTIFNLENQGWSEIIDHARTLPFLFSSRRFVVVECKKIKGELFSIPDKKILKQYLSSPPGHTVLIIIIEEKLRKDSSLYRFFSSFPRTIVFIKEMKRLKDDHLENWVNHQISSFGKRMTPEARNRLLELAGPGLGIIHKEIEKAAIFVGDKKTIEVDDINRLTGWIKSYDQWEIEDCLVKADFEKCVRVCHAYIMEGMEPGNIIQAVVRFFREIYYAKILEKEKNKSRKEIFKELKPHIKEYYNFYREKFSAFFSLVDRLTFSQMEEIFSSLREKDFLMKSSNLSPQLLLEDFFYEYCNLWKKAGSISKRKD